LLFDAFAITGTTPLSSSLSHLVTSGSMTRSYNFYGDAMTVSASCSARALTDASAEFSFSTPEATLTVTLSAVK
ncbi:MAG TPA: hypothetical protein VMF89_28460, partial [Polyangiales bacterium]|nr:hypothetical protein [Polyangiales bacterium]